MLYHWELLGLCQVLLNAGKADLCLNNLSDDTCSAALCFFSCPLAEFQIVGYLCYGLFCASMSLGHTRLTNAVQMQLYFSLKLLGSVYGSSAHLSRLYVGA